MIRFCFSWLTWVVGVVVVPGKTADGHGGMVWCLYLGPFRIEYFHIDTRPF